MENPDVPVGNLIDLDSEPLVLVAERPPSLDADEILSLEVNPPENGDREEEIESDATESADSENDMMSPSRPGWNHGQRSSSESFSSNQSTESAQDQHTAEQKEFMRKYVEKIFTGGEEMDQEEKARFGELCSSESGKGREWFARFVSAQRCNSKCVSEPTFYRLVQSFAVVLFECYQMDDFGPAKNLMTMCFTYYYIGKPHVSPTESREKPVSTGSIDAYLKSANSWLAEKKDNVERLLRTTSVTTENMKGFFGGLESKLKGPLAKRNSQSEDSPREKASDDVPLQSPDDKKGEKIYLYSHLKQQPIWHTLRFWNAAFFDAVHCERRKRSPTTRCCETEETTFSYSLHRHVMTRHFSLQPRTEIHLYMLHTRDKWYHMTQEERDDSLQFNENITFGQLGTFTHNMLAFGLSKKLCSDFLKKQAVIGNLDEEKYKQLTDHIEQMAVE